MFVLSIAHTEGILMLVITVICIIMMCLFDLLANIEKEIGIEMLDNIPPR